MDQEDGREAQDPPAERDNVRNIGGKPRSPTAPVSAPKRRKPLSVQLRFQLIDPAHVELDLTKAAKIFLDIVADMTATPKSRRSKDATMRDVRVRLNALNKLLSISQTA